MLQAGFWGQAGGPWAQQGTRFHYRAQLHCELPPTTFSWVVQSTESSHRDVQHTLQESLSDPGKPRHL